MVVDKTTDLYVIGELDDYDRCPLGEYIGAVPGGYSEVIEGVIGASGGHFLAIVELLNDQVMLRDAVNILISKEDIPLTVQMHLNIYNLLLASLHPLLHQPAAAQLGGVQLEGKDSGAAFPALQGHVFGESGLLKLYEDVVADGEVVPRED